MKANNYPHITRDSKGNIIHYKDSNGDESWREYDERDNRIHFKSSNGLEVWYDSEGNEIPNPNNTMELTLEDIAEKFKVDVKNIKIKK